MKSTIPDQHTGLSYYDFMSSLSQKRKVQRYFEIGVDEGTLMSHVHASVAVGVDPGYRLTANVAAHKKKVCLIQDTSDRFFASHIYADLAGGTPDLCFLDGMHTFEFLLRDFMNTEAICSSSSLICLHDCMPLDDVMTIRNYAAWNTTMRGTKFEGYWTGDVWKIIPILRKYRPDLRLVMVDCPPTGVVCVTNLDPTNRMLQKSYLQIVDEFRKIANGRAEIEKLYAGVQIMPTSTILTEMDNTLFFVT